MPEDRSRPNGRTIRIAIARQPAQSPTPRNDPIVFLAGGPGGTGLLEQSAASGWNTDRDVVFVSQRGTLKANPFLSCPEIDEFTYAFGATGHGGSGHFRGERGRHECVPRSPHPRRTGTCPPTTRPRTPPTSQISAAALGIDEWNVYGVSYGTNLALQLLRDHPEGIRAMVLDGVVPPPTRSVEVDWAAAATGYQALFDACAAQPQCRSTFRTPMPNSPVW